MDNKAMKTNNLIINTYLNLICEKNSFSVSVNEIVSNANISRRTFYNYFGSVDELYDETTKIYVNSIRKIIDSCNFETDICSFKTMSRKIYLLLDSNKSMHKAMYNSYIHIHYNGIARRELNSVFIDSLEKNYGLKKEICFIHYRYLMSSILFTLEKWYQEDIDLPLKECLLRLGNMADNLTLEVIKNKNFLK